MLKNFLNKGGLIYAEKKSPSCLTKWFVSLLKSNFETVEIPDSKINYYSKWSDILKNIYSPFNRITIAAIISVLMANSSHAASSNCDFTKLNFGISQAQLKKAFDLTTIDVATTGEGIIKVGGREICADLPENSMAKLLLLDNNFVQLSIVGENISGELLTFATKTFDKQDNKKKPKSPKTAMWNKKNQYSVMYNSYTEGRHKLERIMITSGKHQSAFDKQNKADDEAIEEEFKANNGKGKGKP